MADTDCKTWNFNPAKPCCKTGCGYPCSQCGNDPYVAYEVEDENGVWPLDLCYYPGSGASLVLAGNAVSWSAGAWFKAPSEDVSRVELIPYADCDPFGHPFGSSKLFGASFKGNSDRRFVTYGYSFRCSPAGTTGGDFVLTQSLGLSPVFATIADGLAYSSGCSNRDLNVLPNYAKALVYSSNSEYPGFTTGINLLCVTVTQSYGPPIRPAIGLGGYGVEWMVGACGSVTKTTSDNCRSIRFDGIPDPLDYLRTDNNPWRFNSGPKAPSSWAIVRQRKMGKFCTRTLWGCPVVNLGDPHATVLYPSLGGSVLYTLVTTDGKTYSSECQNGISIKITTDENRENHLVVRVRNPRLCSSTDYNEHIASLVSSNCDPFNVRFTVAHIQELSELGLTEIVVTR